MKRNMELVQRILEAVAENQDPAGISSVHLMNLLMGTKNIVQAANCEGYIDAMHHLDLLVVAGFLFWRGSDPCIAGRGRDVEIRDLGEPTLYHVTWTGHDLLESLIQPQKG